MKCNTSHQKFKNIIRIAENHNDFKYAIERALENDTDEQKCKRLEIAQNHSWENKIEEYSVIIKNKIGNKKKGLGNREYI